MDDTEKKSKRFWIGIILLVTNQPFGWGGMLISNALALKTHNIFYTYLGFGIYALSWGMLALGALLAGPQGKIWIKKAYNKVKKRELKK